MAFIGLARGGVWFTYLRNRLGVSRKNELSGPNTKNNPDMIAAWMIGALLRDDGRLESARQRSGGMSYIRKCGKVCVRHLRGMHDVDK